MISIGGKQLIEEGLNHLIKCEDYGFLADANMNLNVSKEFFPCLVVWWVPFTLAKDKTKFPGQLV